MICVYCGREKPTDEMTDEHVLPRAIGGALVPTNPFLLKNVCKRCNSAAGRHIDRPFIKSWSIQQSRFLNATSIVDLSTEPVLPLAYMGELQNHRFPTSKVCDNWLGPTGDAIYHFHDPYPDDDSGSVGRPLPLPGQETDDGFVFVFIRASNPQWYPTIIKSVAATFEDSPIYLGNGDYVEGQYRSVPEELGELYKALVDFLSHDSLRHEVSGKIRIDADHRFIAKMALGFGALVLGSEFVGSEDAKKLRDFMWQRDPDLRTSLALPGIPFLQNEMTDAKEILGWKPGHVVFLLPTASGLALTAVLYGEHAGTVRITSETGQLRDRVGSDGLIYVVAPGLRRFAGPVSLGHYLMSKVDEKNARNDLKQLLEIARLRSERPPFDLPNKPEQ